MLLLTISIVALALGPVLFWMSEKSSTATATLDGFVIVTITGLVAVHLIPHAIAAGGISVLPIALFGLLAPSFAERAFHRSASATHRVTFALALGGLAVHAIADGMALALPSPEHGTSALAFAVLIHRLPVALTVWWLIGGSRGRPIAAATLALLAGTTLFGFFAGEVLAPAVDSRGYAFLQALVSGSLLHVVFHQPSLSREEGASRETRAGAGFGALIGLLLVWLVSDEHFGPTQVLGSIDFSQTFLALVYETAPVLIFAFAAAGLVRAVVPHASRRWLRGGGPNREALRGVVFGLPLPICSCGVVPLYDTLIRQGVPATAAMAFLVATPELGLDALLISVPLLGVDLTLVRIVAAFVVAILAGRIVGAMASVPRIDPNIQETVARGSLSARLRGGLSFGFREIVDDTGPWILFGLIIAALAEPLLDEGWLHHLPWGADVFIFAVLGVPLYVCASGATPLAAILIHKGVSPGAALALLLAGPATNLTTFGILSRLHSRRVALAFGIVIATLAIALGLAVNLFLPGKAGLELHRAAMADHGPLTIVSAITLVLLYAASILRIGPRGFIAQVTAPFGNDDHDHCHDDHH